MATISVQIKTNQDYTQFKKSNNPQANMNQLYNLVNGVRSGYIVADCFVTGSSSDPVAASGTITLTYAAIDANDTVTIGGVVLTAKTSGANGTTQFNKVTDLATTTTNLTNCINANTTLNKHFLASCNTTTGVVTLTAKTKGSIGNLVVMSTSDATAFDLVQIAGGTGGSEDTAVQVR